MDNSENSSVVKIAIPSLLVILVVLLGVLLWIAH